MGMLWHPNSDKLQHVQTVISDTLQCRVGLGIAKSVTTTSESTPSSALEDSVEWFPGVGGTKLDYKTHAAQNKTNPCILAGNEKILSESEGYARPTPEEYCNAYIDTACLATATV